jgi:hypothetical protein
MRDATASVSLHAGMRGTIQRSSSINTRMSQSFAQSKWRCRSAYGRLALCLAFYMERHCSFSLNDFKTTHSVRTMI